MNIEFTENLKGVALTKSGKSEDVSLTSLRICIDAKISSLMGATAQIENGNLQIGTKTYFLEQGHFQYFFADRNQYSMFYQALAKEEPAPGHATVLEFSAEKKLTPTKNIFLNLLKIWPETTTVYFKLTDPTSKTIIAAGVIKISAFSFANQFLSLRVTNAEHKVHAFIATMQFLKNFCSALIQIYF